MRGKASQSQPKPQGTYSATTAARQGEQARRGHQVSDPARPEVAGPVPGPSLAAPQERGPSQISRSRGASIPCLRLFRLGTRRGRRRRLHACSCDEGPTPGRTYIKPNGFASGRPSPRDAERTRVGARAPARAGDASTRSPRGSARAQGKREWAGAARAAPCARTGLTRRGHRWRPLPSPPWN